MEAAVFIEVGLAVVATVLRQVQDAQRGVLTPEQLVAYHANVMNFMRAVQLDADTLRGDNA